ncbi:rhamnose mutarotase [Lipomyces orientalis]|uniref:Rhamnose mutarotase n=1 Tax=Lipomyces orientalis TaxID=1233043 RepID=A0ACC3TFP9_9ASCO
MSPPFIQSPPIPGKRVTQVVKIRPEFLAAYKDIHKSVWPEVLECLRDANIVDYSIHYNPQHALLIGSYKYIGDNWDVDSKKALQHDATRRWWQITDAMQETLISGSTGSTDSKGWWMELEEVFRFEG